MTLPRRLSFFPSASIAKLARPRPNTVQCVENSQGKIAAAAPPRTWTSFRVHSTGTRKSRFTASAEANSTRKLTATSAARVTS
ncbi:MAG: hypothetical protein DME03_23840, partial [Candidatus Rokuibacteriota bacterium]